VDIAGKSPRILSVCSGYGGIELGLERIFKSVSILAYVEIEAFAIANLVAKMEEGKLVPAPVWTDVKTFRGEIFRGMVDILIGGYPCQPFSAAGKRKGTEDQRHLWPYILQCIRACRPPMVFFENVEGHLSLGISEVLTDLEALDYTIEVGIFSAAEVGAPHRRKRVFILGYSRLFGSAQYEIETTGTQQSGQIMADTESRQSGESQTGNRRSGTERGSEAMAYSESSERQQSWHTRSGRSGFTDNSSNEKVMADSFSKRLQGYSRNEYGKRRQTGRPDRPASESRISLWPARPGEEQYDWEEPRTIEPGLGRAADGASRRIDRLRLLGNGVVPQTAEKSFRTLYKKLNL